MNAPRFLLSPPYSTPSSPRAMSMHPANAKDSCHLEMVESRRKPAERRLSFPPTFRRIKELHKSEDDFIQPLNSSSMEGGAIFAAEPFGQGYVSMPSVLSESAFPLYSSSSDYSPSSTSPSSSLNSEVSFSEAELYPPISSSGAAHSEGSPQSYGLPIPCVERLEIWRNDTATEARHIYACIPSDSAVPLQTLTFNPPSPAVQATLVGLSSPLVHLSIPLPTLPHRHRRGIKSLVTISANRSNAVYFILDVYKQGVLVGSYEEEMIEESQSPFGSAQFSSTLPLEFVDGLYERANRGEAGCKEIREHVFIMRFLQEGSSPSAEDVIEVILTAVTEFSVETSSENEIILSYLSLDLSPSPVLAPANLAPLSPSAVTTTQSHSDNPISKQKSGPRQARTLPKLSLAIPPRPHIEGIHLYTDSPTDAPSRSMPPMDMPESALSASPMLFSHSSQSLLTSLETETPCDLSYPFSLSSTSPRMLDLSTPDVATSAPAWQISRSQNAPFSPFTPSFFHRYPLSACEVSGSTLSPVCGRSDSNVHVSHLSILESDASSTRSPSSQYSCDSFIHS